MATKNPRINITIDSEAAALLDALAGKQKRSVSSIAHELILEALDRREDLALSKLAEKRDKKKSRMIKHEDAWK
jgi:predicted transcriptional regulator